MRTKIERNWKPLTILLILSVAVWSTSSTIKHAHAQPMTTFKVATFTGRVGDTLFVPINVYDAEDLWGWQVMMSWDPAVLRFIELTPSAAVDANDLQWGDFLSGQTTSPDGTAQVALGYNDPVDSFMIAETTIGTVPGVGGSGWLVSLKFEILAAVATTINIDNEWTFWQDSVLEVYGDTAGEMIKENGGYVVPWDEDINMDGLVDILDLAYVAINYGKTAPDINPPEADVNGDGVVDIIDLSMVAIKYGQYAGY